MKQDEVRFLALSGWCVLLEPEAERETWSPSNLEILIIMFGPVASEHSVPANRSVLCECNCSSSHRRDKHNRKIINPKLNICPSIAHKDYNTCRLLTELRPEWTQQHFKPLGKCLVLKTKITACSSNISSSSAHPEQKRDLVINTFLWVSSSSVAQHRGSYLELHSGAAVCFQVCAWTSRQASRGLAPFWIPKSTPPPKKEPNPSSCSFSDKLTEPQRRGRTDKTDWPLPGLAMSSEGSVQVHAASPQRAEGKRGHGRA